MSKEFSDKAICCQVVNVVGSIKEQESYKDDHDISGREEHNRRRDAYGERLTFNLAQDKDK
jgi:hypothetical protein